jgi:hypothetical protein
VSIGQCIEKKKVVKPYNPSTKLLTDTMKIGYFGVRRRSKKERERRATLVNNKCIVSRQSEDGIITWFHLQMAEDRNAVHGSAFVNLLQIRQI